MNILNPIHTALKSLRRNVGRALLTMLGIVIGIAAVIAMMEIGQGASASLKKTISSMGSNNLILFPGSQMFGGVSSGAGSGVTLTPQDCAAIMKSCPAVRQATVMVRANGQAVYGNKNWTPGSVVGATPAYLDVREWQSLAEGEPFTDRDVSSVNKVCLVGQVIKRELFNNESPVGKELRINNVPMKVLGVLTPKGANLMGQDQDDTIVAPWTTIRSRISRSSGGGGGGGATSAGSGTSSEQVNSLNALYPSKSGSLYPQASSTQQADNPLPVRFQNVDQIQCAARSSEDVQRAIKQITELLRDRHHLRDDEDDDFTIRDMAELTNTLSATSVLMTRLLLFVALISLIVGGVGIMNIMLVSVTERTREIGLRLAVGARGYDILLQFLIEAILLCLAGGLIGIALGRGASILVTTLLGWPTEVSISAIIMSVVVAVSVGLVFGFYPAWRASRLNPIEALRYE